MTVRAGRGRKPVRRVTTEGLVRALECPLGDLREPCPSPAPSPQAPAAVFEMGKLFKETEVAQLVNGAGQDPEASVPVTALGLSTSQQQTGK